MEGNFAMPADTVAILVATVVAYVPIAAAAWVKIHNAQHGR